MKRIYRIATILLACFLTLPTFVEKAHAADYDIGHDDVELNANNAGSHVITGQTSGYFGGHHVNVASGNHTITLRDVSIDAGGTSSAMNVRSGAEVTLILEGDNELYGANNHPAIWVEEGARLTIKGDGALIAAAGSTTLGRGAAGIGGGYGIDNVNFGDIIIESGHVSASGSQGGAGIGGGYYAGISDVSGNITIRGGQVSAVGGSNGAGIGAGQNCAYTGMVEVSGGVVYANGNPVSIGGGARITGGDSENYHGAFSTGTNGNAVIIAPKGIGANRDAANWDGIFISYEGNENSAYVTADGTVVLNDSVANIQVWGDPIIDYPLTVAEGADLRIVMNDRNDRSASLTMAAGNVLTNNGMITLGNGIITGSDGNDYVDASLLRLLGGLQDTAGTGSLSGTQPAAVQLPLEDALVQVSGMDHLIYDGTEKKPQISVAMTLWGYRQSFYEGTDKDYVLSYQNNINAGDQTAKLTASAANNGNLIAPSEYVHTFSIAPAKFTLTLPEKWSIKQGEDRLLEKLPEAKVSSMLPVDQTALKNGTLTWYLDETHSIQASDTSLANKKVGENTTLYWSYVQNDPNFESVKSGKTEIHVVKYQPATVIINEDQIQDVYGNTKAIADLQVSVKVQQNNTDTILPITSGLVWTSDDESVVKLSDDGNRFEFVGVGEAHLIVTVPEHEISGDPDNSYASASGTVTVMVTPKSISVDPSSVEIKDRAYNGKKEVAVKAALQQSMIIKGDDVTVTAAGVIEDANADAAKKEVQIHYALQGNDAKQYRLDPDTGKGSITITKADPQTAGMEASSGALQIYNQKAQTYYFPLSTLLPKPSAAEDGTILTLGACTYELDQISLQEGYLADDGISFLLNEQYLKIEINAHDSDQEGVIGTIRLTIKSANYEDLQAEIIVSAKNPNMYRIQAEAGVNGSIDPSGSVQVAEGKDQQFVITAKKGYVIEALTIDENAVTEAIGQSTYTCLFKAVDADHIIHVSFKRIDTESGEKPSEQPDDPDDTIVIEPSEPNTPDPTPDNSQIDGIDTGDTTVSGLWLGLLLISALAGCYMWKRYKQE